MSTVMGSHLVMTQPAAPGTSAPILEYLCLFTHDLRRKQKRWQDGRIKYHTFNRRIMAYDDRGNFIGDMHWRSDWDFDAGEEIQLERGGVIVQVSDCVGQQSQDLSELVDKRVLEREQRAREKEQRGTNTASPRPPLPAPRSDAGTRPVQSAPDARQMRHRPLTALIGTPTGHHGRAVVPTDSPFEQRRRIDDAATSEVAPRPTKRRRYEDMPPSKLGYAQSLFGTALTLSGAPSSSARFPSQPLPIPMQQRTAPPRLPLQPSLEAEDRDTPASTLSSEFDRAAGRGPRCAIDDPRTNLNVNETNLRQAKVAHDGDSPPRARTGKHNKTSSKRRAKPASPAREMTSLTLFDVDDHMNAPEVTGQSLAALPHHPGNSRASKLLLDRSTTRIAPSVQAELLLSALDSTNTVDSFPVQHDANAPNNHPRRTELRLKSKKKRGLLLVSEQVTAKPSVDIVEELLPTEKPSGISDNYHLKDAEPKPGAPLLDSSLILRSGARSSAPSVSLPDTSLSLKSGRCREDGHHMCGADDGSGVAQKTQSQEHMSDLESEADVSVNKTRNDPKAAKIVSDVNAVDEPVKGRPRDLGTERVSEDDFAQHYAAAAREEGYANLAERTALPPAPRLVKLSRKSVRSKELIGFVFSDTDVRSRKSSCSNNPTYQTRTEDPGSDSAPCAPVLTDCHNSSTVICKDGGPAGFTDTGAIDAAVNDVFTHPSGTGSIQSVSRRSRSPHQPPSPARVERFGHCAQEAIKDKGIIVPPSTETGDGDSNQPSPGDMLTVPSIRLPKTNQATRDQFVREAGIRSDTMEVDVRHGIVAKEPPRLVNPATRGRKAALKSHAAGQVPQPIIPAKTEVQGAQIAQREQTKDIGPGSTACNTGKALPKIKMTFPGFVSAKGGGPWSREAHDLLETGRPS
ncbi:hypothetical protein BR93DRAFT_926639 [Coniochaeta sp. PMI_546]|nr:hypothetical protein BR93DRAFT_926639 [Coniochaeta sp. PMI_546]